MSRAPSSQHRFGQPRPSGEPPHSQEGPLYKGNPFQPLPAPTGASPFRLDLARVIPDAAAAMQKTGGMVFHVVGDTGGILNPTPQQLVANGLEQDADLASALGKPAFFYHLGDVIYFDGEARDYFPQFYQPYEHYPNPILAIPGNHDGARYDAGRLVNPEPSLAPFVRNFCAAEPGVHSADAREAERTAMIQPNVYWTLLTPFATFVGLYTNVPEGGVVKPDQQAWFSAELKAADKEKALIVAMHHPIHSLDTYHSGSKTMAKVLAEAVSQSGRHPDIVFAGHVHNYQRFMVSHAKHGVTPFVVAGNGGYHNLHAVMKVAGQDLITPYRTPADPNIILESYVDDRFGFLRLEISKDMIDLKTYTVPRPQDKWRTPPRLYDRLRFDWRTHKVLD